MALALTCLQSIITRVPRRLQPDRYADIVAFLVGGSVDTETSRREALVAALPGAGSAAEAVSPNSDGESDTSGDDIGGPESGGDGRARTACGVWKPGFGPVTLAALSSDTQAGAAQLASALTGAFDLTIAVPYTAPPSTIADEVRERSFYAQCGDVQRVLVVVDVGSLATPMSCDSLYRLVAEVVSLQAVSRPHVCDAPLCFSVAVVTSHAVDAPRISDPVLLPLRQRGVLDCRYFEEVSSQQTFSAFLFEAVPLFPCVLSVDALRYLEQSWSAAERLSDVVYSFHSLIALGDAHGTRPVLYCSGNDALVSMCLAVAETDLPGDASYAARATAFAACYTAACLNDVAALRGGAGSDSAQRRLACWLEAHRGSLIRLGVAHVRTRMVPAEPRGCDGRLCPATWEPAALVHFPAAPVDPASQLGSALAPPGVADDSGTGRAGFNEGGVSDAARLLHVLRWHKATEWIALGELAARAGGMTDKRLHRALFDLKAQQLVVVNATKRTVRSTV